jgi:hypothetical protein
MHPSIHIIPLSNQEIHYINKVNCLDCSYYVPCDDCLKVATTIFRNLISRFLNHYGECGAVSKYRCLLAIYRLIDHHYGRILLSIDNLFANVVYKKAQEIHTLFTKPNPTMQQYALRQTKESTELLEYIKYIMPIIDNHIRHPVYLQTPPPAPHPICNCSINLNRDKLVVRRNTRSNPVPLEYEGKAVYIYNNATKKYTLYWENYCDGCKATEMKNYA